MRGLIILLVALVGCTKRNPDVCCETPTECLALGTDTAVHCEEGACVAGACVMDNSCNGPEDCTAPMVCTANVCTLPPMRAFDVVYANEMKVSDYITDPVSLEVVVINTGATEFGMSSLTLVSVDAHHPGGSLTAAVKLTAMPHTASLIPGKAGGKMGPAAEALYVDSGLVPESRVDTMVNYVEFQMADVPNGFYDIKVDAVLKLDTIEFPVPFVIHVVSGPTIYADPEHATRATLWRP